jgi:hypothetical protein
MLFLKNILSVATSVVDIKYTLFLDYFSVTYLFRKILDMASVRSISTSKPPERLLTRRFNRTATSTTPLPTRRAILTKTTPINVSSANSRAKSSRMALKKSSVGSSISPARLNLSTSTVSKSNSIELATNKMASTTLNDLPPIRIQSRISDTTNLTISRVNSDTNKSIAEQPNDTSETSASPTSSSPNNSQFTLESFDVIRTVGTGKNLQKFNFLIMFFCSFNLGTFGRVQVIRHRDTNVFYALKTMSIKRIIESKQVEHVRNEKDILSKTNHPFLVRLHWATHTNSLLYLLLEYLPGGELFQMMRKREKIDAKSAIFYASEVLLGLDYLHHLDVLYRDLKPVRI